MITISLTNRCLGFILLLFSLGTTLFGFPWFRFGIYQQTESLFSFYWLVGGWAFLWISTLPSNRLGSYLRLPIVWAHLAMAGISGFSGIELSRPWSTWVGSPYIGEGVLTFLSHGSLSVLYVHFSRILKLRAYLVWIFLSVGLGLSTAIILGSAYSPIDTLRAATWVPLFFPDGVAFIVLPLFVVLQKSWIPKYGKVFGWTLLLILGHYSLNRSLFYAFCIGCFFASIPYFRNRTWILMGGLISLSVGLIVYAMPCVSSIFKVLHLSTQGSLISRSQLAQIYYYGWLDSIKSFLIGHGWSSYRDTLACQLLKISDVSFYQDGVFQPSAELIFRNLLHSHNAFLESLNAVGIIGCLVLIISQIKIYQSLRVSWLGVVFFVTHSLLTMLWFEIPHAWPFTLMAMCLLCRRSKPCAPWVGYKIITLGLGVFLTLSSLIHSWSIQRLGEAYQHIEKGSALQKYTFWNSDLMTYDKACGGHRWLFFAEKDLEIQKYTTQHIIQICQALLTDNSVSSLILANNMMAMLDYVDEKLSHALILCLLERAPSRTDIIIPYLSDKLFKKQDIGLILDIMQKDCVFWWFKGLFEKNPDAMSRALVLGIQRLIPIPDKALKNLIQFP